MSYQRDEIVEETLRLLEKLNELLANEFLDLESREYLVSARAEIAHWLIEQGVTLVQEGTNTNGELIRLDLSVHLPLGMTPEGYVISYKPEIARENHPLSIPPEMVTDFAENMVTGITKLQALAKEKPHFSREEETRSRLFESVRDHTQNLKHEEREQALSELNRMASTSYGEPSEPEESKPPKRKPDTLKD